MSFELDSTGHVNEAPGFVDPTATSVETPAVVITEDHNDEAAEQAHTLDVDGDHDTSTISAPDERGKLQTDLDEQSGEFVAEVEIIEFTAPSMPIIRQNSKVYVAASYESDGQDLSAEEAIVLGKKEIPAAAAAEVPPELPPVEETTTSSEEPDDARAIAEKMIEIEDDPAELPEDRDARTDALTDVVKDMIETNRALDAAERELASEEAIESAAVEEAASDDSETEEQRNGRIDRVASALSDLAATEAEQRAEEDRDPGDSLTDLVDPADVTRVGLTAGRVDVAPPIPTEVSAPMPVETGLPQGEVRILSEDGWQTQEHTSEYDPMATNIVNAPVGTALVGRATETGGPVFNGNSEGCRIVTLWNGETGDGSLVHIGPEDMRIGVDQLEEVFTVDPALAGPTVEAHVLGDVETSPLGTEIASGLNARLATYLQVRGIPNVTVISAGRGKDVTLDVKSGRLDVKSADGDQIYINQPAAPAPTE